MHAPHSYFVMVSLDADEFLCDGGMFECTIDQLYNCDEFFLQREQVFINFFKKCMASPSNVEGIISVLFGLACGYHNIYSQHVSATSGSLEKRHRAGKVMIVKLETSRIGLVEEYRQKFSRLSCIIEHLRGEEDGTFEINLNEDTNLIFDFIEQYLYENYWKWLHASKGLHVSNFIKERPGDESYDFSDTMLDKIYDITGYLCGARLYNLMHFNRLKSEYRYLFHEYYTHSRYPNGHLALQDKLPAHFLLFRQHSEGLYFSREGNFNFIKILQAIFMQCLSTDVLILFNSFEPIKLVHKLLLNSVVVQKLFKISCYMLPNIFDVEVDLAVDKSPICYLFQFLIQGFMIVYSKDIYQHRLSNVLLSKTGASGIRTALLTLSAEAQKKKSVTSESNTTTLSVPVDKCSCSCGREFTGKGWLARHMMSCSIHINKNNPASVPIPIDKSSIILDNLLEMEGLQDMGDFSGDSDMQAMNEFETFLQEKEDAFDLKFVSSILDEE